MQYTKIHRIIMPALLLLLAWCTKAQSVDTAAYRSAVLEAYKNLAEEVSFNTATELSGLEIVVKTTPASQDTSYTTHLSIWVDKGFCLVEQDYITTLYQTGGPVWVINHPEKTILKRKASQQDTINYMAQSLKAYRQYMDQLNLSAYKNTPQNNVSQWTASSVLKSISGLEKVTFKISEKTGKKLLVYSLAKTDAQTVEMLYQIGDANSKDIKKYYIKVFTDKGYTVL